MAPDAVFTLDGHPDVQVARLTGTDAGRLQELYEACADFTILVDGEPPGPQAAADDLAALPPGSRPDDKHVFGLVDATGRVVAMLEAIRDYPEPGTWWVGLMLVDPRRRRDGLGTAFSAAFERWAADQGCRQVALGVVSANAGGLSFWRRLGFTLDRTVEAQSFGRLTHDVHVLTKPVPGGTGESPAQA